MQQMIQQLEGALQNAAAEAESKASDKAKVMIEAYKAETERMQVIAPAVPPDQVALIVQQTVQQMLQTPLQGAMPQ
jgi:hypothetical protein